MMSGYQIRRSAGRHAQVGRSRPILGSASYPLLLLLGVSGLILGADGCFSPMAPSLPGDAAVSAIVSITPDHGPVEGGTEITINGLDFEPGMGVFFGEQAADVEFVNQKLLRAIAPAHDPGQVVLVLVDASGDEIVTTFSYLYEEAEPTEPEPGPGQDRKTPELVILSIGPDTGPITGGTIVTILGEGFVEGMVVLFGDVSSSAVNVVNSRLLTAVAPPQGADLVNVTVVTPDGQTEQSEDAFEYAPLGVGAAGSSGGGGGSSNVDRDGDGLADQVEIEGWEIWVDYFGIGLGTDTYGNFPGNYRVTSDPNNPNTDGDGLNDYEEFHRLTDPNKADTDGDHLEDSEEVWRWRTSPISVDTDGDCRGPSGDLVPNANLFDGAELKIDFENDPTHTPAIDATSPTLADTDGDGPSDHEEYDNPNRSPIISELPEVEIHLVDAVDVRLDVEYAEEQGRSREYGETYTESHETNASFSYAAMFGVEFGIMWGFENAVAGSLFGPKAEVKQKVELSATFKHESTFTGTWGSSDTIQNEYSELVGDSQTMTETASTGSMTAGVRISNPGNISYHLDNLAITVRYWEPELDPESGRPDGTFKTMATLRPALESGVTLAPGDTTPVLQVEATDVNADRIKLFMQRPSALHLETPYFDLEAADGMNFAFLEEVTQTRTAGLIIDFGKGNVEKYRFATNINRDQFGEYTGVNVYDFMTQVLGIDVVTVQEDLNGETVESTLSQVRGQPESGANTFNGWLLVGSSAQLEDPDAGFEDIFLLPGDSLLLKMITDDDEDGLNDDQEELYGTIDDPDASETEDFDGDGLNDYEEVTAREVQVDDSECDTPPCYERVAAGWEVTVEGEEPYHVFSDPRSADADGDELNDLQELNAGTDPNKADTDGDGLNDSTDLAPLAPAVNLYVKAGVTSGDGLGWGSAFGTIEEAIAEAQTRNGNAENADDVVEIWVAAGEYTLSSEQPLLSNVGIFGGFVGDEIKRSQRDPNPFTNSTAIIGQPGHRAFLADSVKDATLDGFAISEFSITGTGDDGGAVRIVNSTGIRLAHLHLINNSAPRGGAVSVEGTAAAHSELLIAGCVFSGNRANLPLASGFATGGALYANYADMVIHGCEFLDNVSLARAGAICAYFCDLEMIGTRIAGNQAGTIEFTTESASAGAMYMSYTSARITNCRIAHNIALGGQTAFGGGVEMSWCDDVSFTNCVFWANTCYADSGSVGGALKVNGDRTFLTNCTIAGNWAGDFGDPYNAAVVLQAGSLTVTNSIVAWNGWELFLDPTKTETAGANFGYWADPPTPDDLIISHTCVYPTEHGQMDRWLLLYSLAISLYQDDPGFDTGWADSGVLRLGSSSPLIDFGNNFVDIDPGTPGVQFLPEIDILGSGRIQDGNNDGVADVDAGAYEVMGAGSSGGF